MIQEASKILGHPKVHESIYITMHSFSIVFWIQNFCILLYFVFVYQGYKPLYCGSDPGNQFKLCHYHILVFAG